MDKIIAADRDLRGYRCGYGILSTGDGDPFIRACVVHDYRYLQHRSGDEFEAFSRERADGELLNNMLRLADGSLLLQTRAYIYYFFVRTFGGLLWNWGAKRSN